MHTSVDATRWRSRIARARALADQRPAVAEVLRFYAAVAEQQQALATLVTPAQDSPGETLASARRQFIASLAPAASPTVSERLVSIARDDDTRWRNVIDTYWKSGGHEPRDVDEVQLFIAEALLQPFAEMWATNATRPTGPTRPTRPTSPTRLTCPICTGLPVAAVLREVGHGARRSLLCGLCLTEWPAMRLTCVACSESTFDRLPVFGSDEFGATRIAACETCKTYVKTIDLTHDGAAVPIVDDLATLPLDLWAREQGFSRVRANLLRV